MAILKCTLISREMRFFIQLSSFQNQKDFDLICNYINFANSENENSIIQIVGIYFVSSILYNSFLNIKRQNAYHNGLLACVRDLLFNCCVLFVDGKARYFHQTIYSHFDSLSGENLYQWMLAGSTKLKVSRHEHLA